MGTKLACAAHFTITLFAALRSVRIKMRTKRAITHNIDMPDCIRHELERRPVFVTIKTPPQRAILVEHRDVLREAIETVQSRRPFVIAALVLLPDHPHAMFEPKFLSYPLKSNVGAGGGFGLSASI